jgi:hypothetical protein
MSNEERHKELTEKLKKAADGFVSSTIKMGDALKELEDDGHWKDTHSSFDSFCRDTFGFDEQKARIIMHDAAILKHDPSRILDCIGFQEPTN